MSAENKTAGTEEELKLNITDATIMAGNHLATVDAAAQQKDLDVNVNKHHRRRRNSSDNSCSHSSESNSSSSSSDDDESGSSSSSSEESASEDENDEDYSASVRNANARLQQ